VGKLVGRMLSRDPTRRPTDLREVFDVLRGYTSVSAQAFAEPALESRALSDDHQDGTRASTPAVAWVPKTQPETLANQQSPAPSSPTPNLTTSQRRARIAAGGLAIAITLLIASSVFRGSAAVTPSSERRNPPTGLAPTTDLGALLPPRSDPLARKPIGAAESAKPSENARAVPTSVASSAPVKPAAVRRAAATTRPNARPATSASVGTSALGSPAGASCERSRDCGSRLCVAFVCE
jgi:hypothetical protein